MGLSWDSFPSLSYQGILTKNNFLPLPPLLFQNPAYKTKAGTYVQDSSAVRQFLHLPWFTWFSSGALPWDKKGTLSSQYVFCLHHCSKCIKAWLLHLVWLVVLWPLWNLAAPLLGTSHFRHRTRSEKKSHYFIRGNWPWLSVGGGITVVQFSQEGIYLVHR